MKGLGWDRPGGDIGHRNRIHEHTFPYLCSRVNKKSTLFVSIIVMILFEYTFSYDTRTIEEHPISKTKINKMKSIRSQ